MIRVLYVYFISVIYYFLDGDWEADHEQYAKFDEVSKIKWPDDSVSKHVYKDKCNFLNYLNNIQV